MGKPDLIEFIISFSRWTFGIAWNYYSKKKYGLWQLEISVQIPIIALSIFLEETPNTQ